jgi:Domain of unknown function (DUF4113)
MGSWPAGRAPEQGLQALTASFGDHAAKQPQWRGFLKKKKSDAVGIASAAKRSLRSTHASRQERRSPRYTTRLDEVLVARA